MDNIVADFIEYLTGTKNYSSHTATAYQSDIYEFIKFMTQFADSEPDLNTLARADTIFFRSFLADCQRR